jgi:hypothetical protein
MNVIYTLEYRITSAFDEREVVGFQRTAAELARQHCVGRETKSSATRTAYKCF